MRHSYDYWLRMVQQPIRSSDQRQIVVPGEKCKMWRETSTAKIEIWGAGTVLAGGGHLIVAAPLLAGSTETSDFSTPNVRAGALLQLSIATPPTQTATQKPAPSALEWMRVVNSGI